MTSDTSLRPVSPLRARMIEDMTVRGFNEHTRRDYVCESASKRDPGQNSSNSLKSAAKTPDVGVPIGADRPPETKSPSMY